MMGDYKKRAFDAIDSGDDKTCIQLITKGKIDINAKNSWNETLIIIAINYGRLNVCKVLLERKDLKIHSCTAAKTSALMMACMRRNIDICQFILNRNDVVIDQYSSHYRKTALGLAVKMGFDKICKLLLSYGANPSLVTDCYFSPEIKLVFKNWKTYLPPWSRFNACKFYPVAFTVIALEWLLCCKRLNVFPKDIRYLMIEYIAEEWKRGWSREDLLKRLLEENKRLRDELLLLKR